jgi:hypothetical protein
MPKQLKRNWLQTPTIKWLSSQINNIHYSDISTSATVASLFERTKGLARIIYSWFHFMVVKTRSLKIYI